MLSPETGLTAPSTAGTTGYPESQIQASIAHSVAEVFRTMLNRPALLHTGTAEPQPLRAPPVRQIVGTVGFAGEANGMVYLWFTETFARWSTGHMLGMTEAEIEEMGREAISDAVGELSNMVVGLFKNDLCDAGFACKMSIPATVSGTDFTISPWPHGAIVRHSYRFDSLGDAIVADVVLKIGP